MVFLHGLLSSRHDWDPVRERLDFPSVALDIPGFGHVPTAKAVGLQL